MTEQNALERLSMENRRLQELLTRDTLTGVSSRLSVQMQIAEALSGGGTMLMCDLDNFKQINDRLGHLEGDACLRLAAEIFSQQVRSGDILGRVGGDEFVIFLPGLVNPEEASQFKARLQFAVRTVGAERGKPLAVSAGVAISRPEDTYETLFARADQALLEEKRQKPESNRVLSEGNALCHDDLLSITRELVRKPTDENRACRVDYETFRIICRFLARRMQRCRCRAWILLFSLRSELSEEEVQRLMPILDATLVQGLRAEDVCTRYSTRKMLVLLPSTNSDGAATASRRLLREIALRMAPDQLEDVLNVARMPLG